MSLKKSNNNDAPIFDKPAQKKATGFFIRRLMSLAGKPVLAEKNLPISPSTDEFSEKCYVSRMSLLYRQQKIAGGRLDFKPTFDNCAVPQNNTFAQPDRFQSEFNHISAYVPKLKTVVANRAVALPSPLSISKDHQGFARRFDTRIKAGATYTFAPLTFAPALIGTYAKLRSIKLAAVYDTIRESALFSGLKNRLTWQPQDFTYPDLQLIFSSQFPDRDSAFFEYLPEQCNFALYPGNYGFLPAVQTALFRPEQNSVEQRFTAKSTKYPANFDSRTEFARNLVILCNSFLRPVEGDGCASHAQPQNPVLSLQLSKKPLNPLAQYKEHLPNLLIDAAVRLKAAPEIVSPALRSLKAHPGPQATHNVLIKEDFAGTLLLNLACQASRSRLKLKLSLKHVDYSDKKNLLQTLVYRQTFPSQMPAPARLTCSYPPLVLAEPTKKLVTISPKVFCASYTMRRCSMRFTANRHANYCRKTLKTIFETRTESIKKKQNTTGRKCCISSTMPVTQRFSDKFTSTRLYHEAINVIYLRSMPFLMKLSAMDFTDIFLPDAQRRAAPSSASFYSNLAPLPPRRRNTLKSLRFKLTRINDGYVSVSLRAQRRILSLPGTFGIHDAISKFSMAEPARLSTGTGEKSYNPGYRGKLERFAFSGCVPAQITGQLKLNMAILGTDRHSDLPQRHFIYPTAWEAVNRPHKCRILLAPHPFGFPTFRFPTDNFRLVESAISFKYKLPAPHRLSITDICRFTIERKHLPPLSLKDPRRFLFSDNSNSSKHLDKYHARSELRHDKFPVPQRIDSFAHEWGLKKLRKLSVRIFHRLPALRSRQKATASFTSAHSLSLYQTIPPRQELLHFFTPRIKHLLLSYNKFLSTARYSAAQITDRPTTRIPQRFLLTLQIPVQESFRKPANAFSFTIPRRAKFDEKFNQSSICKSATASFRHRTRVFTFPYQPEYSSAELSVAFKVQEEPLLDRLTFFDQTGLENCYLAAVGLVNPPDSPLNVQMVKDESPLPESFATGIARNSPQMFIEPAEKTETRLDYERAKYQQQIDESALKKLIDVARLKLRKFKHIRSQITGYLAKNLLPARNNFSHRNGSRIPPRLACDNLHWVILLRSFIEMPMPDKNLFNARMASAAEPDISTLTASFSCTFRSDLTSDFSDNLRPARRIDRYALSTLPDTRIFLEGNQRLVCCVTSAQTAFVPTFVTAASYSCIDAACDFTMFISERPEYRRNIELYILHMAIDIDDYTLDSSIYGRSLAGQPVAGATSKENYRQLHIPEWIDLPQAMVHRAMFRI